MLFAPTKFTARRKTLASAIALLICSSPVLAQQPEIEEIVVTSTPIRDSQIAALEAKRNALNMSDVVAADTIGRFPDQNLAPWAACRDWPLSAIRARHVSSTCVARRSVTPASPLTASMCRAPKTAAFRASTAFRP